MTQTICPPGHPYVCAICKRGDVRLYRSCGSFFSASDVRCNAHVPAHHWQVPLVTDERGNVWGYMSVPQAGVAAFEATPEADPFALTWRGGTWVEPFKAAEL